MDNFNELLQWLQWLVMLGLAISNYNLWASSGVRNTRKIINDCESAVRNSAMALKVVTEINEIMKSQRKLEDLK